MQKMKGLTALVLAFLCLTGCGIWKERSDSPSLPPEPSVSVYAATGMDNPDVRKNEYQVEAFGRENGFVVYRAPGIVSSIGIDVSFHQQEIDWEQVAAAGVEYAMIRVGYRGYETGNLNLDRRFEDNIKGALSAGLRVGIYFFSQAVDVTEAEEEAVQVAEWIREYEITYPVVFNWEPIPNAAARTDGVDAETVTECAAAFCEKVKAAGYIPMVYFNKNQGYSVMNLAKLKDYHFWLAEYTEIPQFQYHFEMWQYSGTGSVPGISLPVDLNICFAEYPITADE